MRIGVTGSAGVGKTMLSLTLGGTLGVPVIQEAMRKRLESGFNLHALTREEHRGLLREDLDDLVKRSGDCVGGFVADRTRLDFLAFWLCAGHATDAPAGATQSLLEGAADAIAGWDLVVVLPWGALPLVDDGVRYANPWHQLHFQAVIEGLCSRYVAPDRLVFLPADVGEPDDRCRWVLRRMGMSV